MRSGKGKTVWTIHGYQRADAGERKKAETFPNGDQAGEETKHCEAKVAVGYAEIHQGKSMKPDSKSLHIIVRMTTDYPGFTEVKKRNDSGSTEGRRMQICGRP